MGQEGGLSAGAKNDNIIFFTIVIKVGGNLVIYKNCAARVGESGGICGLIGHGQQI